MSQSPAQANTAAAPADPHAQAQQQTGQRQLRLSVDDRHLTTIYCNAFRTNASAEEMILDFGMNMVVPSPAANQPQADPTQPQVVGEMLFAVNNRVVFNFLTAKRLAIMLGQLVRAHEERFGELKLNAADRLIKK